jgi:transmembrane sensor
MEHGRQKIADLFFSYAENRCTDEEKQEFFGLFKEPGYESMLKEFLYEQLMEFSDDHKEGHPFDFDGLYDKMLAEIKHRGIIDNEKQLLRKVNRLAKGWRLVLGGVSIAAVFLLAFYLGRISFTDRNRAEATLPPAVALNEIKAPLGSKSEVKLADGTEIMLNAGSSIRYGSDFNALNRNLILEGEAYFKVAKNNKLPLIVSASNINIKATGTEFNVKAYSEEGIVETTLLEGAVEISQIENNDVKQVLVLKPNEKAIYSDKSDQITLDNIKKTEPLAVKPPEIASDKFLLSPKTDVDQVIAWTQNKLIIKGENLESLCIKLQRKYGVNFVFGDEAVKEYRFSGTLLDETFEQVMDAIKLSAPIDYMVDGKTVILSSDKNQIGKYSNQ